MFTVSKASMVTGESKRQGSVTFLVKLWQIRSLLLRVSLLFLGFGPSMGMSKLTPWAPMEIHGQGRQSSWFLSRQADACRL